MNSQQYKTLNDNAKAYVATLDLETIKAKWNNKALLNANGKLQKGDRKIPAYGLELSPFTFGGFENVCDGMSDKCILDCIAFTGVAQMLKSKTLELSAPLKNKLERSFLYHNDYDFFMVKLSNEIQAMALMNPDGMALRLNVTSDVRWETMLPLYAFRNMGVKIYDYSKNHDRELIPEYNLTYSLTPKTSQAGIALLKKGHNVAMAFDCNKGALKKLVEKGATFQGFPILNGDLHDERYDDPRGHVVALSRKVAIGGKGEEAKPFFFPVSVLEA